MQNIVNNSKLRIGLLLGLSCALIYGLLTDGHDWGGDFSEYIMQAKSISEQDISGHIEDNQLTVGPTCIVGITSYPWGFPMLLAPLYKAFGLDIIRLKMVGVTFYVLFLLVIYYECAQYHSRIGALGVTAVFALNPYMLGFLNQILSDIPFLFISTLCVFLIGRVTIQRRPIISFPIAYMLLGVILGIAFLLRTHGILLVILTALTQFISTTSGKRNGGHSLSFAHRYPARYDTLKPVLLSPLIESIPYVTLLCFLGLLALLHVQLISGGASQLDYLDKISLDTIAGNIIHYATIPKYFFGRPVLYAATVPFVLIGIKHRYENDYHILIYAALLISVCIIWPGRQDLRYLFPLLPFYVSFLVTGIEVFRRPSTIFGRRINLGYFLIAAGIMILSLFAAKTGYHAYNNIKNNRALTWGPFTPEAGEMFHFIKNNTSTEDIIVFHKPRVMRLMTDRMSIDCGSKGVGTGDYVVIFKQYKYLYDLYYDPLKNIPQRKTVFDNEQFMVVKI